MNEQINFDDFTAKFHKEVEEATAWAKAEGYSLSRISHNARLSQETQAFTADILKKGKRVGEAQNSGHGGNTGIQVPGMTMNQYRMMELWVDDELCNWLAKRDTDRQIKRFTNKEVKRGAKVVAIFKRGEDAVAMMAYGAFDEDRLKRDTAEEKADSYEVVYRKA